MGLYNIFGYNTQEYNIMAENTDYSTEEMGDMLRQKAAELANTYYQYFSEALHEYILYTEAPLEDIDIMTSLSWDGQYAQHNGKIVVTARKEYTKDHIRVIVDKPWKDRLN